MIMDVFCFSISLGHLYLLRTRSNPATQIRRVPVALPNAAPPCMARLPRTGLGTVITANGTRRGPRRGKHGVPVQICQLGWRDGRSLSRADVHVAYGRIRSCGSMTAT